MDAVAAKFLEGLTQVFQCTSPSIQATSPPCTVITIVVNGPLTQSSQKDSVSSLSGDTHAGPSPASPPNADPQTDTSVYRTLGKPDSRTSSTTGSLASTMRSSATPMAPAAGIQAVSLPSSGPHAHQSRDRCPRDEYRSKIYHLPKAHSLRPSSNVREHRYQCKRYPSNQHDPESKRRKKVQDMAIQVDNEGTLRGDYTNVPASSTISHSLDCPLDFQNPECHNSSTDTTSTYTSLYEHLRDRGSEGEEDRPTATAESISLTSPTPSDTLDVWLAKNIVDSDPSTRMQARSIIERAGGIGMWEEYKLILRILRGEESYEYNAIAETGEVSDKDESCPLNNVFTSARWKTITRKVRKLLSSNQSFYTIRQDSPDLQPIDPKENGLYLKLIRRRLGYCDLYKLQEEMTHELRQQLKKQMLDTDITGVGDREDEEFRKILRERPKNQTAESLAKDYLFKLIFHQIRSGASEKLHNKFKSIELRARRWARISEELGPSFLLLISAPAIPSGFLERCTTKVLETILQGIKNFNTDAVRIGQALETELNCSDRIRNGTIYGPDIDPSFELIDPTEEDELRLRVGIDKTAIITYLRSNNQRQPEPRT